MFAHPHRMLHEVLVDLAVAPRVENGATGANKIQDAQH